MKSVHFRKAAVVILVLLAAASIPAVSFRATRQLVASGKQVARSQETLAVLESTIGAISDAETGTRGYSLTGDERFLQPYHTALVQIPVDLARLHRLASTDSSQQRRLEELKQRTARKREFQAENIVARRKGGIDAAAGLVAEGRGQVEMEGIRQLIADMQQHERDLLITRTTAAEASAERADFTILSLAVFAVFLAAGASLKMARDMSAHERAQRTIEETNEKLSQSLEAYGERNRQIELLVQLSNLLQSCVTPEEAYAVVVSGFSNLMPGRAGALAMIRPSRDVVEVTATWGGWVAGEQVFTPVDCWGLRRGRIHVFDGQEPAVKCNHTALEKHLCVPLAAHGETIGLITLEGPCREQMKLIEAAADELGLSLANLRLQENLRAQSIRDPLTDLFNRRYLEQTLDRELVRARRQNHPLAVLLLDVDHFKRFNDTFGHQAGDDLLRAIGELLHRHVRADDVASRYGGEEFAVVLPDAGRDIAHDRGERLRHEVSSLTVRSNGQALGQVTTSIGVSWYPAHGDTGAELLRAADRALYAAKAAGRDLVVVAEEPQAAA